MFRTYEECTRLKQLEIGPNVISMRNVISHGITTLCNIIIKHTNITNANLSDLSHSSPNTYRLNIYVPAGSTTNNVLYGLHNAVFNGSASIIGRYRGTLHFMQDPQNKCYFDPTANVFVYYTL